EKKAKEIQEDKKIKIVVSNSVNLGSCKKNLEISKKYPKIKFAAGLYPEESLTLDKYKEFEEFLLKNKKEIVAIGEIGLDKTEKLDFEFQKEIFVKQLDFARNLNLPVIIHTRKTEKEVLEILEKFPELKIVLHCFSGNFKFVKEGIELGCYFSIPTNVVKSEHFQKMLTVVPKEKILTETDSPYLSPFPEKKNEPAFITESIKKISEIWKTPKEETEKLIEKNFERIFL
ncbi:MAG: Hydrolase, TatD family, partial [candidate division WS6 bacterium GW2011_GWC2_36_7]